MLCGCGGGAVLSKGVGLSYNQKLGAWLGAKRKDKKQGVKSKKE